MVFFKRILLFVLLVGKMKARKIEGKIISIRITFSLLVNRALVVNSEQLNS
jgi:hypothetical protein